MDLEMMKYDPPPLILPLVATCRQAERRHEGAGTADEDQAEGVPDAGFADDPRSAEKEDDAEDVRHAREDDAEDDALTLAFRSCGLGSGCDVVGDDACRGPAVAPKACFGVTLHRYGRCSFRGIAI